MQAIHDFFAAWGEADDAARGAAMAASLSDSVTYDDPMSQGTLSGAEAIAAYVGGFTQAAPGAVVSVARLDSRGDSHRAAIEFRMSDGKVQMGQYFIETDASGKPARLTGFAGMGTPE